MPDPVVDPAVETENQRYRRLVSKAWNDPELGPLVRKLAKAEFPEVTLPEETMAPLLEPFKKQNQALADELKAMREERAAEKAAAVDLAKAKQESDFSERLKKARQEFNLTDEGFDKMVAHMKETGNYSDPRGAAAFIVSQNPPPPPPGPLYGPGDLNFAGSSQVDDNYKLLHQNPEKYFDSEVRKMLSNPRDYVAKEMGDQYATLAFGR